MAANKINCENFREILKNDGYKYVLILKDYEPIVKNFPNIPNCHKRRIENNTHELPDANIFWFEYKGLKYKLLRNGGMIEFLSVS